MVVYLLGLLFTSALADNDGSIDIEIDGQQKTVYAVSASWAHGKVQTQGKSITLTGGRAYFSHQNTNNIDGTNNGDIDPSQYLKVNFLGKTLEYQVDHSKVHCSCNAAFYIVAMPGYSEYQHPDPTSSGDYYCDAMKVGGEYCPDFDISEANAYTMQSTLHACNAPIGKHFNLCDTIGCGQNLYDLDDQAMCPSPDCQINTQFPYTHKVSFILNERGRLTDVVNQFIQGNNFVSFSTCNKPPYLLMMQEQMKDGMVPVMSLWGSDYDDMAWLDGNTGCVGGCSNLDGVEVTFSNFKIYDAESRINLS